MRDAEKKAAAAVVRAAKRWRLQNYGWDYERPLDRAVFRLLREEAKTKEKRRGK